jgi:hypothetical protein
MDRQAASAIRDEAKRLKAELRRISGVTRDRQCELFEALALSADARAKSKAERRHLASLPNS